MEEYRVKAMRARNQRCAELGVNCGEPRNGSTRSIANYRIWKEIGESERMLDECECRITPVENVDVPRGTMRRKRLMNWHLFHVEHSVNWKALSAGALPNRQDHLIGVGQMNGIGPSELRSQLRVHGGRSFGGEQYQIALGHA